MLSVYYNEFDRGAAEWLRELMKAGVIPEGVVDERSIADVDSADLAGYDQCHFFAGIGGWAEALRLAGGGEWRGVWTGSCPCQPYSSAGKQGGDDDPRNLWPEFRRLIAECKPAVVFGEQVASAIGHGWIDGVQADVEGEGYACGYAVLGAHSVGAKGDADPSLRWVRERLETMHGRSRMLGSGRPLRRFSICGWSWDGRWSELHISDSGCSGWPTPRGRDWEGGYQGGRVRNGCLSTDTLDVVAQLAGWPTPMAGTGAQNGNNAAGNTDYSRKVEALCGRPVRGHGLRLVGWPTPNVMAGGQTSRGGARKGEKLMGGLIPLAGWATCTVNDAKGSGYAYGRGDHSQVYLKLPGMARLAFGLSTLSFLLGTGRRGALRPGHSRWLMGYREEWDCCGAMAMQSCRRTGRSLSKRGRKGR